MYNDWDGDPAWQPDVWDSAAAELDMTFVASIKIDTMPDGSKVPTSLPSGVTSLPQLGPDEFVDELAKSRVLVGVGNPRTCVASSICRRKSRTDTVHATVHRSPTPYEALCMGVPFINPVMGVCIAQSSWGCRLID